MVTLREIQSISPYDFEKLIAELWETKGYDTEVRRQSRDKGIDIDAERAGLSEKIQVKRYSGDNKIGSNDVRKYATIYQQTDANNVVLVTSGKATDSAEELAQDLSVNLIDGKELIHQLEASSVDLNDYTGSSGSESIKDSGVDKTQSRQDRSSKSKGSMYKPATDEEPDVSAFMHNPDEEPEVLDLATYKKREGIGPTADEELEASELVRPIVYHILGLGIGGLSFWIVSIMLSIERGTAGYYNLLSLTFVGFGILTIGFAIKDDSSIRIGTWAVGLFYIFVGI